jgi:hypothetical protein
MLKLIDLIRIAGVDLGSYKIHCAIVNKQSGSDPLQAYFSDSFDSWQSEQTQKNFQCDQVLSLISLGSSLRWLYVGVYKVDGEPEAVVGKGHRFWYRMSRVSGLEHLDGRVVVDFEKNFRASYLVGSTHENSIYVNSIRDERMSIADFPGFHSVRLPFALLQAVIRQAHPSWRAALGSISGVYLIADLKTGRQYIGSAYGGVGIWQRWTVYANTGHGGNHQLRELLRLHGEQYAENFQFSLIEVCDINANAEYIIGRECHWKDVLLTRDFGLNSN